MKLLNIKSNVWLCSLLPFGDTEKNKSVLVNRFQQLCLDNNIFGIGWNMENRESHAANTQEYLNEYKQWMEDRKRRNEKNWPTDSLETSLKNIVKIEKGDYVFVRLRSGNYLVGKVLEKHKLMTRSDEMMNQYSDDDKNLLCHLSWYVRVERWQEKNSFEMPAEVVGTFSQRNQRTLSQVLDDRKFRFNMYARSILNEKFFRIPITEKNFHVAFNYQELEDLVAGYITENNPGFSLLPSTCKSSTPLIEFVFANNNGTYITCQVKNKQDIDLSELYAIESNYEKIYVFSGLWEFRDNEEVSEHPRIIKIGRKVLFEYMIRSVHFKNLLSSYYDYKQSEKNHIESVVQITKKDCFVSAKDFRSKKFLNYKCFIKQTDSDSEKQIDLCKVRYVLNDITHINYMNWNTYYDAFLDLFVHYGDSCWIDKRLFEEFDFSVEEL